MEKWGKEIIILYRHIRDGGVAVDARNKFLDLHKSGIDLQFVFGLGTFPYASACATRV